MNENLLNETVCPCGTVLIIDDDESNRLLLRDPLEAQGHQVFEAEHGEQGLLMVKEHLPDVVLLDIMMPRMDGFEVCRLIKSDPATAHLPVLMVTALNDRKERLLGIQAGANDFFTKPIDITEIILRVRNAIHTKHLFDELRTSHQRLTDLEVVRDKLTHIIFRELRSPLTEVLAILQSLQEPQAGLSGPPLEKVAQASRTLSQLEGRFNSLLELTRARADN
jgi:PleD family two-component response regulator